MFLMSSTLRPLLETSRVRRYARNQLLFERGEDGDDLFIVLDGEVEIFVDDHNSRTLVARKGPGSVFGELAPLNGGRRIASAVTLEDSRLAVVHRQTFIRCLDSSAELRRALQCHLISLVTELTARISTMNLEAYGRLRYCLYSLARERDGVLEVPGRWTQRHLAEQTGCTRETIAKITSRLKNGGWVSFERRRIVIHRELPEEF
jgi:CRP-like cAMP-binding protein